MSQSCGSGSTAFTYQGMSSDTQALPSTLTVDAATGSITALANAPVGTSNIVVYAILSNQQSIAAAFSVTGMLPLSFGTSPSSLTVFVGQTQTTVIPAFSDPNGFSMSLVGPYISGTTALPSFVTYNSATQTITYVPSFSNIGSYNITFSITNGYVSNSYSFILTIDNKAPFFTGTATSSTATVTIPLS